MQVDYLTRKFRQIKLQNEKLARDVEELKATMKTSTRRSPAAEGQLVIPTIGKVDAASRESPAAENPLVAITTGEMDVLLNKLLLHAVATFIDLLHGPFGLSSPCT